MVAAEMNAARAENVVRKWSATPSGVLILTHEKFRDWGEAGPAGLGVEKAGGQGGHQCFLWRYAQRQRQADVPRAMSAFCASRLLRCSHIPAANNVQRGRRHTRQPSTVLTDLPPAPPADGSVAAAAPGAPPAPLPPTIGELLKSRPAVVVVDEAHVIKSETVSGVSRRVLVSLASLWSYSRRDQQAQQQDDVCHGTHALKGWH